MAVVGIDLGTTNTVVATDEGVLALDEATGATLPSVVAFLPSKDEVIGSPARRRRAMDPKNTLFSSKRIIGQSWHSVATKEFRRRYPFDLEENAEGIPAFNTRAGVFTAVDIATRLLAAVARLGEIDRATTTTVITVPSVFRDPQRAATLAAARGAGFADVRILDEPSATAAANLAGANESVEHALVFDLGGGTFDVAIVSCQEGPFRVMGHGGDLYLGGDDVDLGLADWAAQNVLQTQGWDLKNDASVLAKLVVACEEAKIRLSQSDETTLDLGEIDPAAPLREKTLTLSNELLSELASNLVRRTFIICDEVLMKTGIKAKELDAVYLAGGATHLKTIREGVAAYFQREVEFTFDPMEVVAIGACIYGAYDEAREAPRR